MSKIGKATVFMRHAEYGNDGSITPNGLAQARSIAIQLSKTDVVPEVIFTSPVLRARQTADEIVRALTEEFGQKAPAIIEKAVLSDRSRVSGAEILLATTDADLVVTHQPILEAIEHAFPLEFEDRKDKMLFAGHAAAYVLQSYKGGAGSTITLVDNILTPRRENSPAP